MRNISVRDVPCWDPNVLNALSTNCICERVFASSANLQLALPVRGLDTKRGIENSFPCTQTFVQARNKKCLQQLL